MTTPTRPRSFIFPAILLVFAILIAVTLFVTAGTSNTAASANGTNPVEDAPQTATITYTSGMAFATGPVDDEGRRQGEWNIRFEGGAVWWEAHYVDDVFDPSQPWTEYNDDGSVRFHSSDGAPPHQPPREAPVSAGR